MKKLFVVTFALLVTTLAGQAAAQCDDGYVAVEARAIRVTATGVDDTANLQCAFDLGAAMGPGVTVWLEAGTFYTEQLVIRDFRGRISGMGAGVTVLHNPAYRLHIDRPCEGSGPCFVNEPPSETNRHPSLVSLLGTDVTLQDLSVVVSGGFGTEDWYGWGRKMKLLSNAVQVMGSGGSYRLERVAIDAGTIAVGADGVAFGDAANAAMMWSFGQTWFVTGATLVLSDSVLRGASGIFTYQIDRSRIIIRQNRFEVSGSKILVGDTRESQIMVEGNELRGLTPGAATGTGVGLVPNNLGQGVINTSIWVANNTFAVAKGIEIRAGMPVDVRCEAVNNDMSGATTPYVLNGYPCKVVGGQ